MGPGFSADPSALEAGAMSAWEPTITPGGGFWVRGGWPSPHLYPHPTIATTAHKPPFKRQGPPPQPTPVAGKSFLGLGTPVVLVGRYARF